MPIDWSKSKYSAAHRAFLGKPPEKMAFFTLCDGAVRSGKTLSIIYKIPQMFKYVGNDYLKVFSGYSKLTVRNNVLNELLPFLKDYHGAECKFNSQSGELDIKLWGKMYNCFVTGGGSAGSDASVQGSTWDFWYANELPKHNYAFYNMALSRLTSPKALFVADSNPESPNHWLYKERIKPFLDGDDEVRSIFDYYRFTMEDNKNLSKRFIENQKKLYKGAFEARKIKGLWTVADGLVYDTFSDKKHVCSSLKISEKIGNNDFIDFFAGLDWGWTHPLCLGFYAIDKNGVYYKIGELFGSKLNEDDVIKAICDKQNELGRYFRFVNADNARPELNYKISKALPSLTVYEVKPKLQDSIAVLRSIINYDRLIVSKKCSATIEGFKTYRYPDETDGKTDDVPVKENDDAMDETRYAVSFYETTFGAKFKRGAG